jgi:uncharacterized protein (TIGR02246 family)
MIRAALATLTGVVIGVALTVALSPVVVAQSPDALRQFQDREAIDALIARYSTGLDTLNPDIYVSAFTRDGQFTSGDRVRKGQAEIRSIITDLLATREKRKAEGAPAPGPMHHVVTNGFVEFVGKDEARHRAYWMTVVTRPENKREIAAMGSYDDVVVRQNGRWLFKSRTLLP